jgi:hypothetical protein
MISRLLAFAGGALIGGGVGFLGAEHYLENKYLVKYQESVDSHKRVMEHVVSESKRALNVFGDNEEIHKQHGTDVETPVETEEELTEPLFETNSWTAKGQPGHEPATDNPYHTAIAATETPVDMFIDGGVNDYGCSYIEEDEYQEDDQREKEQIVIHMEGMEPLFTMNGGEIRDWDERVGDSILVDMFKHCPPGKRQVLYVRNHRTDVDYEVVRELP